MRSFPLVLAFTALTFVCWGVYGPVLEEGSKNFGGSLLPFMCVGVAYFVIAVIVPLALLRTKGEKGSWTTSGAIWSFVAGVAGALGALGVILAFKSRGQPIYVMPLVFGLAPVVNTVVTMAMGRTFREAGLLFYAGVLLVIIGAVGVLWTRPVRHGPNVTITENADGSLIVTKEISENKSDQWKASSLEELRTQPSLREGFLLWLSKQPLTTLNYLGIAGSIALTALSWGSYGPILHAGQMKMGGSRLRPLLCVGLAYFVVAVVVPALLLPTGMEALKWHLGGAFWSFTGGAAGALGALGIILAFTYGGKPIYVMPLVFGCAPVVNTFVSMTKGYFLTGSIGEIQVAFWISLAVVMGGAIVVLVFAPKAHAKPAEPRTGDGERQAPAER